MTAKNTHKGRRWQLITVLYPEYGQSCVSSDSLQRTWTTLSILSLKQFKSSLVFYRFFFFFFKILPCRVRVGLWWAQRSGTARCVDVDLNLEWPNPVLYLEAGHVGEWKTKRSVEFSLWRKTKKKNTSKNLKPMLSLLLLFFKIAYLKHTNSQ